MKRENDYDAIIIGSGMGGLTAASLLAQIKKYRVLILEQNSKIGGFTHTFSRPGGFTWDVGLHYVGEMKIGTMIRKFFDFITQKQVNWIQMKDPFEVFFYPNFKFEVPSHPDLFKEKLIKTFPNETYSIKKYFQYLKSNQHMMMIFLMPKWLQKIGLLLYRKSHQRALRTTQSVLDELFKDLQIKSLLVSQWGDYGLPPNESSFFIHAIVSFHYLHGGYYPEGSSKVIGKSILEIVKSARGEVLLNTEATKIVLEEKVAIGVEVKQKDGLTKTFYSSEIYSDVGAENTYLKLLPNLNLNIQNILKKEKPYISCVSLFLGLKESPHTLGLHGQNIWIYSEWDHNQLYQNRALLLEGKAQFCYLSFPSLKDPKANNHTAEILALIDYKYFEKWAHLPHTKRGKEYEELKEKITVGLLNLVETQVPGFRKIIAFQELGTPLTVEHYTLHPRGQIYGYPSTTERLKIEELNPQTLIKNLFLVGADAGGHGIVGAMMGGVLGVSQKHGFNIFKKINQ